MCGIADAFQKKFKHKVSVTFGGEGSFFHFSTARCFLLPRGLSLAGILLFLRLFRQALNLLGGHNNHRCSSPVNEAAADIQNGERGIHRHAAAPRQRHTPINGGIRKTTIGRSDGHRLIPQHPNASFRRPQSSSPSSRRRKGKFSSIWGRGHPPPCRGARWG